MNLNIIADKIAADSVNQHVIQWTDDVWDMSSEDFDILLSLILEVVTFDWATGIYVRNKQ